MMFVAFGELAAVNLGFKSLQNDFFYVAKPTIETYGIEGRFLKPIFMLSGLRTDTYLQAELTDTWLFHCQEKLGDLRGTGALRYIDAMADHSANEKKQSGKSATIREVLEAQGGATWYAPKALAHRRHVWIRKAFNGVFAPLLFSDPQIVDQRLNSVTPKEDVDVTWEELAAILTLSSFAYSVEINGSSSMGAGVLEAPTTKIRDYPVLDIRALNKAQRKKLAALASNVWDKESPVDWSKEGVAVGKHLRALDEWTLDVVGTSVTADRLYGDLSEACLARIGLAKDKVKKVNKKKTDNIGNVAESIAAAILPRLKSKSFPENFIDGDLDANFAISRELVRTVQIAPLLDELDVVFVGDNGKRIEEFGLPQAQAEAVARAFLLGRSSFQYTSDRRAMQRALADFHAWTSDLDSAINKAIAESALGTGYEEALRTEVFKRLGIHPAALAPNLPHQVSIR